MTPSEIAYLAKLMAERGVTRVEVDAKGERYVLVVDAARPEPAIPAPDAKPQVQDGSSACAAAPGRFLSAHPARDRPEVSPGSAIRAGQILAYLEAGDLVLPVIAPWDGKAGEMLASDGTLVGYGTPLVRLLR
ncbi:acetyl-CoA carboxylase biotin carboxyl carrier protein [Xanthobacter versatilis]|uniref:acetyl-CoA carboxylase biotin carboxyl carrier protein n=1 Tax=Xanthobacter autotrophicus (strain ATCC BAA-1158 / Py2) TaxID=78245 RepID=UPI003726E29C